MTARVPSSHGSLDGGGEGPNDDGHGEGAAGQVGRSDEEADGFDSEEFREWLQERSARRRNGSDRQRREGRIRRVDEDSEEDRGASSKGLGGGLPPEWDSNSNFQDWVIKARLWLATTRAKGHTQGPLMLQRLSGQAFQSFKHWAKDGEWLKDPRGGHRLLEAMDTPEFFGEDTEEELLASLAKLTYHLRRGRDEPCRQFFTRWDDAVRKIREHRVTLPDKYLGFLLINALGITDSDTKALMAFSRGSILVKDVKEWCRKHEMKLQAKEVGTDKKGNSKVYQTFATNLDPEDDDELRAMEEIYRELHPEEPGGDESEGDPEDFEDTLEEHEAKEILNTLVTHKKKTFMQSLKTKRAKALARGYGQWKDRGGNPSTRSQSSMGTSGYVKGGYYRMTLSEAKAKSKCSKCGQIGHWHRDPECPRNQGKTSNSGSKEVNMVEYENVTKTDEAIFCGHLEPEPPETTAPESGNRLADLSEPDVQILNFPGPSSPRQGYKDRVSDGCDDRCSFGVSGLLSQEEFPVFWGESEGNKSSIPGFNPDDLCATIDTGCQRMAIGLKTLQKLDQALPRGFQTRLVKQEHKFRSVHGTSTTKYAAVIPSSLGTRGSLLRPAIFDTPESQNAPFLISLPFLMYCKAVLNLDPSTGLSMELKRFGCKVKCHIGPSGALRVPLGQFTEPMLEKIRKAQEVFHSKESEFEVLRTTQVFAQEPSTPAETPTPPNEARDVCLSGHGCSRSDQEIKNNTATRGRADDSLAATGDEDPVRDRPDDRDDGTAGRLGETSTSEAILSVSSCTGGATHRDSIRDCRGGGAGQLGGSDQCRVRERGTDHPAALQPEFPGPDVTRIQHGRVSGIGGTAGNLCDRGRPDDLGATSSLSAWTSQSDIHLPEGGAQSQSSVLAMQFSEATAMPVLRLDPVSTTLERGNSDRITDGQITEGKRPNYIIEEHETRDSVIADSEHSDNTDRKPGDISMPTSKDNDTGNQRHLLPGEMCGLWKTAEEGAARNRHREQPGNNSSIKCCQLSKSASNDQGGPGRVSGVPGVPPLEEVSESRGRMSSEEPQEFCESNATTLYNRRQRRTIQKARRALETAETNWSEIMSLLGTAPDQVESVGWAHYDADLTDRRKRQKYLWLLQKTEKQLKVVSELYNPNRFQGKLRDFGLCPGQAFDLQLRHDLTKAGMRAEVREYVRSVKPGLVVISPPCTLFSLLQNLTKRNHSSEAESYLRRLIEAKVLLRFGIEIAFEVLKYGGTFVFEHPLTSRAWLETMMQKLIQHPGVHLAACDQCMYGLKALSGLFHRKPTGFLSNNVKVTDQLGRRCDGQHRHEPILGRNAGGSRSKQAQHYPEPLVEAILKGYQLSVGQPLNIQWTEIPELHRDRKRSHYFLQEINSIAISNDIPDKFATQIVATEDVSAEIEAPAEDITLKNPEESEELHRYLPREKPFSLAQLVRRAHEGLGHPGNERLARILKDAKASPEAVALAKKLTCSVCEQHMPQPDHHVVLLHRRTFK